MLGLHPAAARPVLYVSKHGECHRFYPPWNPVVPMQCRLATCLDRDDVNRPGTRLDTHVLYCSLSYRQPDGRSFSFHSRQRCGLHQRQAPWRVTIQRPIHSAHRWTLVSTDTRALCGGYNSTRNARCTAMWRPNHTTLHSFIRENHD